MKGERVECVLKDGFLPKLKPGQYMNYGPGNWLVCTPNGHSGDVSAHQVTEHEDGTITVSPSILVRTSHDGGKTMIELWHGFLERGVWRSC